MIAKLKGLVDQVDEGSLIIDVNGVGYLVHASSRTLGALPPRGDLATLMIETQVREDAITLFGFTGGNERDMFRLLLSVQGVGAKVALAILSVLEPSALQTAIAAQDKAAVARANGVGPKLAARIVNELKDKVAGIVLSQPQGVRLNTSGAAAPAASGAIEDAVAALVGLGYRPTDAHTAVAKSVGELGEDADLQQLITAGLKELGTL